MGSHEEKPRGSATSMRPVGATSKFARQHRELSELAKGVLATLDTRTLALDAAPARRALAAFSGRLRVHAAMEQDALYPRLLACSDPAVVARARELLDEVGDIYQSFFDFLSRFAAADAISGDPEGFSREAMFFLHRLAQRMKRENDELYPMVDDLDPMSSQPRLPKR